MKTDGLVCTCKTIHHLKWDEKLKLRHVTGQVPEYMTAPLSFQSAWPLDLFVCCNNTRTDRAHGQQIWWWWQFTYWGDIWKIQPGEGSGEETVSSPTFLSLHPLFVKDDTMLTRNLGTHNDVVLFLYLGLWEERRKQILSPKRLG